MFFALTVLLSVHVLSKLVRNVKKNAPKHKQNDNDNEALTTLSLILGLLLMILSSAPIRPSKPDMAEPARRWRSTVNNSRAARTNKQTNKQGWWYWWWTAAHRYPALFVTTVASVSLVHWWQQSPFFHWAQCEHCEANMTLTLHFLQSPLQVVFCI